MNRFENAKQKGTGLVETLLIVLFVSLSVVAIIKFQHYLSYNSTSSQQQFDATILGVNKIEALRDFHVLSVTAGYTDYASIASGTQNTTVGNTTYTVTWTVTTNTNPNYKTIDVTVSWTDRFSAAKSVRLVSQVAGVDPSMSADVK